MDFSKLRNLIKRKEYKPVPDVRPEPEVGHVWEHQRIGNMYALITNVSENHVTYIVGIDPEVSDKADMAEVEDRIDVFLDDHYWYSEGET